MVLVLVSVGAASLDEISECGRHVLEKYGAAPERVDADDCSVHFHFSSISRAVTGLSVLQGHGYGATLCETEGSAEPPSLTVILPTAQVEALECAGAFHAVGYILSRFSTEVASGSLLRAQEAAEMAAHAATAVGFCVPCGSTAYNVAQAISAAAWEGYRSLGAEVLAETMRAEDEESRRQFAEWLERNPAGDEVDSAQA